MIPTVNKLSTGLIPVRLPGADPSRLEKQNEAPSWCQRVKINVTTGKIKMQADLRKLNQVDRKTWNEANLLPGICKKKPTTVWLIYM